MENPDVILLCDDADLIRQRVSPNLNKPQDAESHQRIEAIKKFLKSCLSVPSCESNLVKPVVNPPVQRSNSGHLRREMSTNIEASSSCSDDVIVLDTRIEPDVTINDEQQMRNQQREDQMYNKPPSNIDLFVMTGFWSFLKKLLLFTKKDRPEKYTLVQAYVHDLINFEIDPRTFIDRIGFKQPQNTNRTLPFLENAIREWRTIKGSEFVTIKQFSEMFEQPQANQSKKREAQEDDESVKEQAEKRFKPIEKEEIAELELRNEQLKRQYEELHESHRNTLNELEKYTKLVNSSFLGSLLTSSCFICFERLSNFTQNQIKVLPCGHMLCTQCLAQVMNLSRPQRNCPYCRQHLSSSSKLITLYPTI